MFFLFFWAGFNLIGRQKLSRMSIEIQRKDDSMNSTVFPKLTPPRNPKLLKEEPEDVPVSNKINKTDPDIPIYVSV